jgi:hypothetical protein
MNMVALIRELVIKSRPVLGTGNTSGAGKI